MRVLVACEYSGIVRDAFLAAGHEAMSCDLLPTESPGPHYQGDVRDVLSDGWEMMIAHPPCTYLSRAGARWMYEGGRLNPTRLVLARGAASFFRLLLAAPIPFIALENPQPLQVTGLPAATQAIEPYEHGHPYSKKTLLWLRGLPPLRPTQVVRQYAPYLPANTGGAARGQKATPGVSGWKRRAQTFPGIAAAMAAQWGDPTHLAQVAAHADLFATHTA